MKIIKWIALLLCGCMLASCAALPGEPGTEDGTEPENQETQEEQIVVDDGIPDVLQNHKHTLRFDENGEFRVLVLGDLEATASGLDEQTKNAIATLTEREGADLVIFAGDNTIGCTSEEELKAALESMTAYLEENRIPWTHVFGDRDGNDTLSKEAQQAVYQSFAYCLSRQDSDNAQGMGNYVLPVYSADEAKTAPVFAVWGMDSGVSVDDNGLIGEEDLLNNRMYQGDPASTYAYLSFSRVKWYFNTSREIESYLGQKLPSLMCFHIPLQEYYEVYLNRDQASFKFSGEAGENVSAGPINSGMFTALEERGDVKAVVCGHDAKNNFSGEYCDIRLSYAGCIRSDVPDTVGARVFVIRESDPAAVESYMAFVNGNGAAQ